MKRLSLKPAVAALSVAIGLMSGAAYANKGPYIGLGAGVNQADDQDYEFAGYRTALVQTPAVVEFPLIANDGPGESYEYKKGYLAGAFVGYSFENGLRPEFEISYRRDRPSDITTPAGGDLSTKGMKLSNTSAFINLWYDFFPSWSIHPYLGGGGGVLRSKVNNYKDTQLPVQSSTEPTRQGDDATLTYQFGGGLRWDLTDSLTAGIDYRYVKADTGKFYVYRQQKETHFDSDYAAQSLMVSLNYYFIKPAAPVPTPDPNAAAVVPPVADADGDGVPDDRDQCPGTPAGTPVDDKGCPLPPPPPPCKTPELGEKVSLAGCGTGDTIVLRGVNFEFDKSRLTQNAKAILDGVAEELTSHPDIIIELGGHTDAKGSDEYNQQLSEKRAASVVKYLTSKGIAADRMTSAGYGEAQPVADNETDEGRELNRRVELKIVGSSAPAPGTEAPAAAAAPAPVAPAAEAPAAEAPAAEAAPAMMEAAPAAAPAEGEAAAPVATP